MSIRRRWLGATITVLVYLLFFPPAVSRVAAQSGGQVLYNGITLPEQWPPLDPPTQAYEVPSYITNPPAVIPIDVGRQLFVDDFLIQQTTMTRMQHQPVMYPGNPILAPGASDILGEAFPYSDGVWFDPADSTFKMWYYCGAGNMVCYAYSADGKNWTKPLLANAVVPNTNEVLQINPARDSSTVWMDLNAPLSQKFKLFVYNGYGIQVFVSSNGTNWNQDSAYSVGIEYDRTTLFWNPFRSVWVDSLKDYLTLPASGGRGAYVSRVRDYSESPNLLNWNPPITALSSSYWTGPDVNDPPYVAGGMSPQLYNLDAVGYESLVVGIFSWYYPGPAYPSDDPDFLPGPALVELGVGFSRDGFQWVRPTRGSGATAAFIPATDIPGTWNMGNTQSSGGGFLVVGDELWFYFSGRNGPHGVSTQGSTGLATLRRDGFYSMDAGSTRAELTTRSVQFSGKYLFVNVDDPNGQLVVEVTDQNGNVISPFSKANCSIINVNKTLQQVSWTGAADLSSLAGTPVRFNFYLTSGSLYSFWVSSSLAGASNGYLAANGPGFTGPTDNLGMAAYPAVTITPGSVLLSQNQSQQFAASVSLETGTNQAVTWGISPNLGTITQGGVYTAPSVISGNPQVTVTATSVAEPTKVGTATVSLLTLAVANYVNSDTSTGGNWKSVYGVDGYSIANSSSSPASYATLGTKNQSVYTWNSSPTDARALLLPTSSARLASCWFSYPSLSFDVNVTDGGTHELALYFLDWDNKGRSETVQIRDATTNALLDSRTVSNFSNGTYLIWTIGGHVTVNIGWITGSNVVVSGFFFGGGTGSGGSGGTGGNTGSISVTVNPQTINLGANQSQTFAASVQNASTTSVTWSISPNVGTILQTGAYTAPSSVASAQTVTAKALSNADGATFGTATINLTPGAVANFVRTDSTTQGTWHNVYGTTGFSVANNTQSFPGYASVTSASALYTWTAATTDVRALDVGNGSGQIASCWYSTSSITFTIGLSDGNSHQLALYALDWDQKSRVESIQILDATTNAVLNTQTISNFGAGVYMVWDVTGSVKVNVTLVGGPNAVVSGVFLDPVATGGDGGGGGAVSVTIGPQIVTLGASQTEPFAATVNNSTNQTVSWTINPNVGTIGSSSGLYTAPATITSAQSVIVSATSQAGPVGTASVNLTTGAAANASPNDTKTQGSWHGVYGAAGYSVSQNSQSIPSYATFSVLNAAGYTWAATTTDGRALQNGVNTTRLAACWYNSSFGFDVNFTDGNSHAFELYALDWDSKGRVETIQVADAASGAVLNTQTISNFSSGVYLIWNITGHVKITVTLLSGPNAVIGGTFFN